jgi:hypothetical protein
MAVAVGPSPGGQAQLLERANGLAPEVIAQGGLLGEELLPPVDWVTISSESGTTPEVIDVHVDPSGLSVGPHVATIIVIGWPDHVEDRVQSVDVSIFVADSCVYTPVLMK